MLVNQPLFVGSMDLQERRRPGRDSPGLLYCAAVQQYAVHCACCDCASVAVGSSFS
jgi:hypothetical protein